MRIVVCVAAVPNPEKIKWDRFRQLLDLQDAEPVLNPVDRNALELASALAKATGSAFDAVCAGGGASSALREAAVFGAQRLIAVADDALETSDEAGIAAALTVTIKHLGGADVVLCGLSTPSYGSGTVPGYVSAGLDAGLIVDALDAETSDDGIWLTLLGADELCRVRATLPLVITAAPYGIKVRALSPLLLMKAAKRAPERLSLSDIGCDLPLPDTGVVDGPLEPAHGKKGMEVIDGADATTRAITLISALREKRVV